MYIISSNSFSNDTDVDDETFLAQVPSFRPMELHVAPQKDSPVVGKIVLRCHKMYSLSTLSESQSKTIGMISLLFYQILHINKDDQIMKRTRPGDSEREGAPSGCRG